MAKQKSFAAAPAPIRGWGPEVMDLRVEMLLQLLHRIWSVSDRRRPIDQGIIDSVNELDDFGPRLRKAVQPYLAGLRDASDGVVAFWNLIGYQSANDVVLDLAYYTALLLLDARKRANKAVLTINDARHVEAVLRPDVVEVTVAAVVLKPMPPPLREWKTLQAKVEREWRVARSHGLLERVPGIRANISVEFCLPEPTPMIKRLAKALAEKNNESNAEIARKICGDKAESCLSQVRRLKRNGRIKFVQS